MYPLIPIVYNGCVKCDGLFSTLETFTTHAAVCDGNKENSSCALFACPRQTYLKLFSQIFNSENPAFVSASNDVPSQNDEQIKGQQPQNLIALLQKGSPSPSKPIKLIGVVRTRSKSIDNASMLNSQAVSSQMNVMHKLPVVVRDQCLIDDPEQNTAPFGGLDAEINAGDAPQSVASQDPILTEEDKLPESLWVTGDKNGHVVYNCKLCPHESSHISFIRRHIVAHNGGQTMQCDHCDFTTIWRSQLHAHQKQHNPISFPCEHCPLSFKNKSSLTRHVAKKHNGKTNFACKECPFVTVNNTCLRDHMRKHTGEMLYCDQCKFVTKLERALIQHKARHQGIARFVCETCGYRTVESGSFKRHVLIHTGKKLFKCPDCSYKATSRYVVVKHIYGKHIDYKRYACNKCDFKTAYYSGLSMHLMSHEGIKPYKCSLCSYRSNLSSKVKRHCAQKHVKNEAKVEKIDNCLKFDVHDYRNPDVPQVNVKVIRLGEDGAEEEVDDVDELPDAKGAPILAPNIGSDSLLCESVMTVLPSEAGDELEGISMIEGGFGLCNDPTLPLDTHSEDSNLFIPRSRLDSSSSASNPRLRFSAADPLETENSMSDLSHTPFKSNPFGSIGLGLRSESWDNLTLIKPHSFGNIELGSRSESWDNLTQIKPTLFKSFDPRDFLSSMKATDLDTVTDQTKDTVEEHIPIASFNVDQFPLEISSNSIDTIDKAFPNSEYSPHPEKDKPLCSLLSPDETRPIQLQSLNSSCKS